jgi:hypothetical protein
MAKSNGGIIGALNPTSFGKCTVTSVTTGSTTLTTQSGTRIAQYLVVAGGGGSGAAAGGGCASVEVEQEVLEQHVYIQFVEQQHIQLQ